MRGVGMARYRTYRGRHKNRWTPVIVAVLLVCLAAFAFFFITNYITFSEDGVVIQLPFLSKAVQSPPAETPEQTLTIIIPTPTPTSAPTPTPTPVPVTPSPTPSTPGAGIVIPLSSIGKEQELRKIHDICENEGIESVIFEYKDTQGSYPDPQKLKEALEMFPADRWERVALVSVFLDNTIPMGPNSSWAVKHTSGVNMLDKNRNRWLNPFKQEVRAYAVELIASAFAEGFDRVLLQNVCFPYNLKSDAVKYGNVDMTKTEAINLLLSEIAAEYPAGSCVDAAILPETLSGAYDDAGQELDRFEDTFDRLYMLMPEDTATVPGGIIPIIGFDDPGLADKREAVRSWVVYDPSGKY